MIHKVIMPISNKVLSIALELGRLAFGMSLLIGVSLFVVNAPTMAAATSTATTTSLSLISGGKTATSVVAGSVVVLTASVNTGTSALTVGQVSFCDASATYCTDIHLLGTAQLTSSGTAVLHVTPGIGIHSYKAVFAGTTTNSSSFASSTSSSKSLTVSGTIPTATTINAYGTAGSYTMKASVARAGAYTGKPSPTGAVSFLDTSNSNAVLTTATLEPDALGISFLNSQSPSTGTSPEQVVTADFNGDGIPDLATVNSVGSVTILLGNGNGTFTQAANSPMAVGGISNSLAVGDFNEDGIQDLAVSNECSDSTCTSDSVVILFGKGDGTFTQTSSSSNIISSDLGIRSIAVADLNNDGHADFAVIDPQTGMLSVYLGNGAGSFVQAKDSPIALGKETSDFTFGDFNGDGIPDIVYSNYEGNTVTILFGNGDGTFTQASGSPIAAGNNPGTITAADINGDGIVDLAVANYTDGTVTILLGTGDGHFTQPSTSPVTVGSAPINIEVADFNSDGIPDLAVVNFRDDTVTVLFGVGNGTFTQSTNSPIAVGFYPLYLATADFNGDGVADMAAVSWGSDNISVLLTQYTQTAVASVSNITPSTVGTHNIEASYPGDSNFSSSISGTTPLVTPPAQLKTTTTLAITSANSAVTTVVSGTRVKLTATVKLGSTSVTLGHMDFCDASSSSCVGLHLLGSAQLGSTGTADINIIPGLGSHEYKAVYSGAASTSINVSTSTSTTADLSVTSNVQPTTATTISATGVSGDYTLTSTVTGFQQASSQGSPSGSVSFIDTSNGNSILASAALGTGIPGLSFSAGQPASTGNEPTTVVMGDFNGDGIPDIAISNFSDGTLTILLGSSTGAYTQAANSPIAVGYGTQYVAIGDFNSDGVLDLAVLNECSGDAFGMCISPGAVSIFLGHGDGTFTLATNSPLTVGTSPNRISVADFNGDGIQDIAVTTLSTNTVSIYLGDGKGGFTVAANSPITVGTMPEYIAVGDFNRDGIPDMAIANGESSTVSILLGNGNGTFTQALGSPFEVGLSPTSIAVNDINNDGILDLVVSAYGWNGVLPLLGNGDGTFTLVQNSLIAVGNEPIAIVTGDFNGDGIADFATANLSDNTVSVFLGNGNGLFTQASNSPFAVGSGPIALAVADLNANGNQALVVVNSTSKTVLPILMQPLETVTATATGISPLGSGMHAIKASYPGDSNYASSASTTIPLMALPVVIATPSSSSISTLESLTVTVSVNGGTGNATPTGTITLTSGTYYSPAVSLSGGSAKISVVAGSLPIGTDTITASYSGDSTYEAATTTTTVIILLPSFTVTSTSLSLAPGASAGNTSTITVTPTNGFIGSVALTAAITSSPTGAVNLPSLSFGTSSSVVISGSNAETTTLTIGTTSATSSTSPYTSPRGTPWIAGGGTAIAFILLIGVPAQRRKWLTFLALLLLAIPFTGGMMACSGSATGTSNSGNPGTTAGAYIITVTGTSGTLTQTSTINLTVQ
jgi:hypothetical protein